MKTLHALIAVCLLFACFAHAQKERALPKDLPPYGPVAPLKAPTVKTLRLDNGLTIWMVAREGFPKVALTVAVRGGLAADSKDRPGLAEVLAKSVTQGTKTRGARQVAEQFQAVGGDLSARAGQDAIFVGTNVLADKFNPVLPVLADVVMNANFPDAEVKIAKSNVLNSLRSREAQPSFLAGRALARVMFGDHPYGVIAPTQVSIEQTTADDLRREFARRFQPKQAVLVVVGSFDATRAEASLRQAFQPWKAEGGASVQETPKPTIQPSHAVFLVPRSGSVQTTRKVFDISAAATASATWVLARSASMAFAAAPKCRWTFPSSPCASRLRNIS